MKSYEQDLQRAITSSQIIQKSIFQHFLDKNLEFEKESKLFDLALNPLVTLPTEGKAAYLTVFNSLTRQKEELISFLIETSKYETICLYDKDKVLLKHQVSPYFNRSVVVYFDHCLVGAAHSKRWSKSAFFLFFACFYKILMQNQRK